MARFELTPFYLSAIAGSKFPILRGVSAVSILDAIRRHLTPREIMQLVYTITNRGRSITSRINVELNIPADEIHEFHNDPSTLPPGRLADHFRAESSN